MLTDEEIKSYKRDGFIVIRKLIDGDMLEKATEEIHDISGRKSRFPSYKNIEFHSWRSNTALKNVAMSSKVSNIVGQLINLESNFDGKVRLLKDAVLCFSPGDGGCGWHVDDRSFWPCYPETTGVNVWITFSKIDAETGGGLAVAPGSYKEKWAQDSVSIIHGDGSSIPQTCQMAQLAPDIHEKFESIKKTFNMEPGDAIIHDRWCFHRSDPFHKVLKSDDSAILSRYSIRYMPENARIIVSPYDNILNTDENRMKDGHEMKEFGDLMPQIYPVASDSISRM